MRATVIVPTYDHGPLIEHSVGSALAQTEEDIEVLIVGDGVPDAARPAIERVVASDPRIRFLDNPKGPGHGFRHRDEAIRQARSENILYLSDDDIWTPEHVELLCVALEKADFVASLPFGMTGKVVRLKYPHDLADPGWRELLLEEESLISLSLIGHRRSLYLELETGWRRDDTEYTEVWREFAVHTERMATVARPTAAILPATKRTEMSEEIRVAEIAEVARRLATPAGRLDLLEQLFEHEVHRWARLTLRLRMAKARGDRPAKREKRQRRREASS
jgi:glycosyltransferase involved in cell wall biosynthesis